MSRAKKRFDQHGKKVRSIYSPCYEATRIPDGPPGNHRPLLDGDDLRYLLDRNFVHPIVYQRRQRALERGFVGESEFES